MYFLDIDTTAESRRISSGLWSNSFIELNLSIEFNFSPSIIFLKNS